MTLEEAGWQLAQRLARYCGTGHAVSTNGDTHEIHIHAPTLKQATVLVCFAGHTFEGYRVKARKLPRT